MATDMLSDLLSLGGPDQGRRGASSLRRRGRYEERRLGWIREGKLWGIRKKTEESVCLCVSLCWLWVKVREDAGCLLTAIAE